MRDAQLSALTLSGNAALSGPGMTAHRLTPLRPPGADSRYTVWPGECGHTLKALLQILILEAPDRRCSRVHDGYGSLATDLETHWSS